MIPRIEAGRPVEIGGVIVGSVVSQLKSGAVVVAAQDGTRYLVSAPRPPRTWLLIERLTQ